MAFMSKDFVSDFILMPVLNPKELYLRLNAFKLKTGLFSKVTSNWDFNHNCNKTHALISDNITE